MKTLNKSLFFSIIVAVGLITKANAGDTSSAPNAFLSVLSTATAAELPAKSADLVSQSTVKQQKDTTIAVVQAAVGLNPAAAPEIVAAIAKEVPDMAATAAATAAGLVPGQAAAIARVAAVAAPSQAGQIVEAVCRTTPQAYQQVAEAVAGAVPGSDKKILTAIAAAIPSLQGPINQVLASNKGASVPSVTSVLPEIKTTQTVNTPITLAAFGNGSIGFGPPFTPSPGSHTDLNPGTGGTVPTGGRNYASP
jgi:hypothetical protein